MMIRTMQSRTSPAVCIRFDVALLLSVLFALPAGALEVPPGAPAEAAEPGEPLSLAPTRTVRFETRAASWLSFDLAPDGETFVLEVLGDLYLLPVTGGTAKPLTQGLPFDGQPRFSPDGQQIAFVSDRSGQDNLWVISAAGGEPRRISRGGSRIEFASPSWSPDGKHLVTSRSSWGLRTYELWGYHVDGGQGVRLKKAKARKDAPINERRNHLGPVYGPRGETLYYAVKNGGFAYNLRFPQWQVARLDLRTGTETMLTGAPGSAFRPLLSPDGQALVYGTRTDQETALRWRDLRSGEDRELVRGVTEDEQESRFTRDLYPGYAFSPDGATLYYSANGQIQGLALATGTARTVPMTVPVQAQLGPLARFPARLGVGPVKARVLQQPVLAENAEHLVFSAFKRLYRYDLDSKRLFALTPPALPAFYPALSPDGRQVAFVSWDKGTAQIYAVSIRGGRPKRLSRQAGHYTDLVYTPDGKQLLAIRASAHERLLREFDMGAATGAELVRLPSQGGDAIAITPATGLSQPHFGPEPNRVYLNSNASDFARNSTGGLISVRLDGSDRRDELSVAAPGIYSAEDDVQVSQLVLAPDGRQVLVRHAGQVYLTERLLGALGAQTLKLTQAELPAVRLTSVGADAMGFSKDGQSVWWVIGHTLYQRARSDIRYPPAFPAARDRAGGAVKDPDDFASFEPLEADPAVRVDRIEVYRPRAVPEGTLAIVGATVLTMADRARPERVIDHGTVLVQGGRITQVGTAAEISVPADAHRIDAAGQWLLPGFVDTHAHFRPLRGTHDRHNPSMLANLAYGVTTGLDVQPSTIDILAYESAIDAGLDIGPRALSTGPGIFNHHQFSSLESAYHVLRRYRDHYGVRNLKAYISGDRQQRQWLIRAAVALKMMPTTEGSLDMRLGITHALDGFSGNEHNFPLQTLHEDVVQLVARSGMGYTPTLLVLYGGPSAEEYFYSRESPADDAKLRRFTPKAWLDRRVQRRGIWTLDAEQRFTQVAQQAYKIFRAGGRLGVGSHGQLQGLGYHWELWAMATGGFTPAQALQVATIDGARLIGVDQDVGSIEPGKLADLVLLEDNPLQSLRATNSASRVVKGGVVYRADDLAEEYPRQRPLPPLWWQPAP